MSNPYDTTKYMTYVVEQKPGMAFNPKLTIDGQELKVCSSSIYHEVMLNQRLTSLLRRIICDIDEITVEYLNNAGFSNDDIGNLSMCIDDIELDRVPENWEDD